MRLACAAVLTVGAAACGGGNSDNVMAPQANALSAEQVDLALGPEIANTGGNGAEPANDMNAINSVETDNTVESTNDIDANNSVETDNSADAEPADNTSAEQ